MSTVSVMNPRAIMNHRAIGNSHAIMNLTTSLILAFACTVALPGCAASAPNTRSSDGASSSSDPRTTDTASTSNSVRRVPRAPTAVTNADPGTLPYDRDVWQTLLYEHNKIKREVKLLANGVSATTESDDPAVATLIKDHALAMEARMKDGNAVRTWDPVFKELFERHEKVTLSLELTEHGVRMLETATDPETVRLLHSHANGVSDFVRQGGAAAQRETPFAKE